MTGAASMDKSIGQGVFSGGLLVAAVVAFLHSRTIPGGHATGTLPPSFFPQAISLCVAVLALYCLVRELRAIPWRRLEPRLPSVTTAGRVGIALFLLMAGYAFAFERLGYILSTTLFVTLCVALLSLGARMRGAEGETTGIVRWLGVAALSGGFAVVVFYVFLWGFSIALPTLR